MKDTKSKSNVDGPLIDNLGELLLAPVHCLRATTVTESDSTKSEFDLIFLDLIFSTRQAGLMVMENPLRE